MQLAGLNLRRYFSGCVDEAEAVRLGQLVLRSHRSAGALQGLRLGLVCSEQQDCEYRDGYLVFQNGSLRLDWFELSVAGSRNLPARYLWPIFSRIVGFVQWYVE